MALLHNHSTEIESPVLANVINHRHVVVLRKLCDHVALRRDEPSLIGVQLLLRDATLINDVGVGGSDKNVKHCFSFLFDATLIIPDLTCVVNLLGKKIKKIFFEVFS